MNKTAQIGIKPVPDLKSTADILGKVLEINFEEDVDYTFDEFPAYIAESDGLRYALLGVPSEEDDIRDVRTENFELLVEPIVFDDDRSEVDISIDLSREIAAKSPIICWPL